eukprot:s4112_g3.t1
MTREILQQTRQRRATRCKFSAGSRKSLASRASSKKLTNLSTQNSSSSIFIPSWSAKKNQLSICNCAFFLRNGQASGEFSSLGVSTREALVAGGS